MTSLSWLLKPFPFCSPLELPSTWEMRCCLIHESFRKAARSLNFNWLNFVFLTINRHDSCLWHLNVHFENSYPTHGTILDSWFFQWRRALGNPISEARIHNISCNTSLEINRHKKGIFKLLQWLSKNKINFFPSDHDFRLFQFNILLLLCSKMGGFKFTFPFFLPVIKYHVYVVTLNNVTIL